MNHGPVRSRCHGRTSFDVELTPPSRYGGRSHTYTGTVTDSGPSWAGSTLLADHAQLASSSTNATARGRSTTAPFLGPVEDQLLVTGHDAPGVPFSPTITLHLAQRPTVQQIPILGGRPPSTRSRAPSMRPG
jgi:hypothetical protein